MEIACAGWYERCKYMLVGLPSRLIKTTIGLSRKKSLLLFSQHSFVLRIVTLGMDIVIIANVF